MLARCKATAKGGGPCSARPVRPSGWCFWHDPELETERAERRRRGGQQRSNKARARRALPGEALTPAELQGFIGIALDGVLAGRLEPGVANAVANLSRAAIAVREATEVEGRLAALEAAVGRVPRRS